MMRALGLAVVIAVLAAACAAVPVLRASHDEGVVLLPGRDGKVGALVVTYAGQAQTLDAPYSTARVQPEGHLATGTTTPEEVRAVFGPALDAQPLRPVTFVLYFLGNSEDFTPESKAEMAKILPEIAAHPAPEIVVVGHTDRVGSVPYNDALSLRRAERVRNELVQIGIARESILVAGRGEREPLVPTEDEVAEPRNRRVEITVR
ncbi:MAG TPA: OmpA family protein [Methylomirabilota bacterium]|nr:OmpA family protein [Methylomirabilota bacterium]